MRWVAPVLFAASAFGCAAGLWLDDWLVIAGGVVLAAGAAFVATEPPDPDETLT